MKVKLNKNHLIILIISILVIFIDQATKYLIVKNMDIATSIDLIPNFFSLFYVTNSGAAFSSMSGRTGLLILISLLCLGFIISIILKEKYNHKLTTISLGILLGGMLGNLIDRIIYHNVIDFISFKIFSYHFPVFNIADICITCGVIIYIFLNFMDEKFINNK